jgi:flagellar secretion chaperone FliS
MSIKSRDQYLESKVMSAPSHRLHLMLIEGAIRSGRQAEETMRRGDMVAAGAPLMKVNEIVGELLAGVRGQKTGLNKQIANLYWFMFRLVSEAKINDDADKLAEALKLLEFERETWQLVSDKLASELAPAAPLADAGSQRMPARGPDVTRPLGLTSPHVPSSGISLEA